MKTNTEPLKQRNPSVKKPASQLVVFGTDGKEVRLVSLWKERVAVVCFLRHFGCRFCKQQVSQLMSIYPQLEVAGVALVAISLGTTEHAKKFIKDTGFPGELYVDPSPFSPENYEAFGLIRGDKILSLPPSAETVAAGKAAAAEGFDDGGYGKGDEKWGGDVFQGGGVFVLGPGNHCDFSFRSQYAGDHPDLMELLAAAKASTADITDYFFASTRSWLKKLAANNKADIAQDVAKLPSLSTQNDNLVALKVMVIFAIQGTLAYCAYYCMKHGSWITMRFYQLAPEHQALVAYGSIAACVLILAFALYRVHKSGQGPVYPKKMTFFTPKQVDELILNNGCAQCNCGDVDVPVEGYMEEEPRRKSSTGSTCELRPGKGDVDASADGFSFSTGEGCDDTTILSDICCYLREFLAKPHPHLGRKGPTCPFVPASLKLDSIYLTLCHTDGASGLRETKAFIKGAVSKALANFKTLEPREGRKAIYKAIILVFPDVDIKNAKVLIDGVQAELKPDFVEKGLMIGEFHLHNNCPGLHNKDWYPLRTPYPCLAIRHMAPTDIVFLNPETYPPRVRLQFLKAYVAQFENQGTSSGPSPPGLAKNNDKEIENALKMIEELEVNHIVSKMEKKAN